MVGVVGCHSTSTKLLWAQTETVNICSPTLVTVVMVAAVMVEQTETAVATRIRIRIRGGERYITSLPTLHEGNRSDATPTNVFVMQTTVAHCSVTPGSFLLISALSQLAG